MLGLTRQERQVILFLISVALIGMGLNFFLKKYTPVKNTLYLNQDTGKIDLNSAGKELLLSVSGIGERIACRIMEYRDREGGFKELAELKNIKGINDYNYEKIKDSLIVK